MHFELVTSIFTAAVSTGSVGAAVTGDSLVVRQGRGDIKIISAWSTKQTAGFDQIVSPTAHDTTRGWRAGVPIAFGNIIIPIGHHIPLTAAETLSITMAGGAVAGDIDCMSMLLFYENFPGISMRTVTPLAARKRMKKMVTIEASVASVATGQYVSEAITADSDLLHSNTDYALLGMSSRTAVHSLTFTAPDFGNVRVGVPGNLRPEITNQWFDLLARSFDLPLIPIFNSGNKQSVNIGFSSDENAGTTLVTAYLAELS